MGRNCRIASKVLVLIVITLTLMIAGCGGGGGTVTNPVPQSFILSSPQTITMGPNSTLDVRLGLVGVNGFSGTVQVTVAGLPAGVTASQNPVTISGIGGTITLNASTSVALGSSSNLTFQGTSGSLSSNSSTSLSIAPFPPFILSLGFSSQTIRDGGSLGVSVAVVSDNFITPNGAQNYAVQLALSGLPAGVSGSFSSNPVSAGKSATLTLTAAANAPLASGVVVKVTGTRQNDGQQQSGNVTVNVTFPIGQLPNNRTDFISTNDTPAALVYDSLHQLIFASLTELNRVVAISPASKQIVAQIPVAAPGGLSLSPDNHQLLVGSWTKVVSWIDTGSLQVVQRAVVPPPSNLLGNNFAISPVQAIQAANGKVLLLSWVDVLDAASGFNGPFRLMEWDPVTNMNQQIAGVDDSIWATNADHSVITIDGPSVTVYDSATDSVTTIPVGAFFPTPNPAGTQIAMIAGSPLEFYDKTGTLLGSVDIGQPGSGTFDRVDSGGAFSPDGTLLYVVVSGPVPRLVTVDAVHYQVVRVAPAFYPQIPFIPDLFPPAVVQAADGTGLAFAIGNHGVVLEDTSPAVPFSTSAQSLLSLLLVTPDETALNTAVGTTISTQVFTDVPDVFFGAVRGTAQLGPLFVQVTAPPSSIAGPVNVKVLTVDGNSQMIPQAFSYGVTPVLFADMAAPAGGGVPFDLFAYGIDPGAPNTLPQITIGGIPVTVQKTVQVASEIPYPFALEHAIISVPSGATGVHDVSFTSSAGSATLKGRFHYLSSVTNFAFPGTGNCVIQDVSRNQLYFAGGSSVLVFSLASHSFLPSYNVPFLHSGVPIAVSGLSLTPDGTHLVTANLGDSSISIIDLNNPAQSVAVAIPTDGGGALFDAEPFQVAATSHNTVFVNTAVSGITGGNGSIYQVDLASQAVTRRTDIPEVLEVSGNFMAVSGDGSTVAVGVPNTSGGNLMVWHAATDQWSGYQEQAQFWLDIAIARDGNKIAATPDPFSNSNFPFPILYDPQLNSIARADYSDLDGVDNGRGLLFDQTGALLYSPTPGVGVDIFDAHTGELRERVRFPEFPSNRVQSTVVTPAGDEFIFITGGGFTEVRLDSVPLGIGSVTPAAATSGTQITLRGTGFTPGTQVVVGGTSVAVTFVDASTLTFSIPSLPAGPARIALSNPDGSIYVRDAALMVQ